MKHLKTLVFALVFAASFFLLTGATAQEYQSEAITNFHSDITVNTDGSLNVTETITVQSTGDQINHGIYRDFPTVYRDGFLRTTTEFNIISVLRDGKTEPYHTERATNGVRVYIGSADYEIPPGEHTYQLKYQTTWQLGFFETSDELYWNVTGNGWIFPIKQASASVHLPGGATISAIDGYTGAQGATDKNFSATGSGGEAAVATTQKLDSYEGLTIVIQWPAGFITRPTPQQSLFHRLSDNRTPILALVALALILLFYFNTWRQFGNDPARGTIIPEYDPPRKLSAAAMSYVAFEMFTVIAFTAHLIELAVRGLIVIKKEKQTYTIERTDHPATGDDSVFLETLLSGEKTVELKNTNHEIIRNAKNNLKTKLTTDLGDRYFKLNTRHLIKGVLWSILLTVAVIVASAIGDTQGTPDPITVGILLFFGVAVVVTNILFGFLLRVRSPEGRKLMDEIEGFKWFLSVTEKDRMNFHNPPERTPELFEKFLPFALALGVQNKWAEQFAEVFKRLEATGQSYHPAWYVGTGFNPHNPAGSLSSFSSSLSGAVSSASKAPGSSSGFGGGGSGGGGGGGGGGGW